MLSFLVELISKEKTLTMREVSRYGAFSGPYFPAFGLNTER